MKKKLILALLFSSFRLFADCEECCYYTDSCEMVTPSARGCADGWGLYVTGEYLYFKTIEDQLAYTKIIIPVSSELVPTSLFDVTIIDLDFDWDSGFRVGIGYNTCHDCWDLYASWTYFQTNPFSCTEFPTPELALTITQNQGHDTEKTGVGCAKKACADWRMRLNAFDFEIARHYCISDSLSFRPFFGVKLAYIDQRYKVAYDDIFFVVQGEIGDFLGSEHYDGKGDFWGVGPRLGVDTKWYIGCGFDLFADISGSLLSGSFDSFSTTFIDNPTLTPPTASESISCESPSRLRPIVEIKAGIEWSRCFCDCYFLNIGVAYEVQYYWAQMEIPYAGLVFSNGDLTFHGLNVSLRFDF